MDKRIVAAVLSTSLLPGCSFNLAREIPPPMVPEKLLPQAAAASTLPAGPGQGRVTIATADGEPAHVDVVVGHQKAQDAAGNWYLEPVYQTVCPQTPCFADFPLGDHEVRLTSIVDRQHGGTGHITAVPQPTAYRYALGHDVEPTIDQLNDQLPGTLMGFGLPGLICGTGLTIAGPDTEMREVGIATLLVGVGLFALAFHLMRNDSGKVQQGTGVQWVLGS